MGSIAPEARVCADLLARQGIFVFRRHPGQPESRPGG